MKRYKCVRRCHGFRGGTWDEGAIVDAADGEDVPRHFVPIEQYEAYKDNENKPMAKNDPMNPTPGFFPNGTLQPRGGMGSQIKPDPNRVSVTVPGEDI